MTHQPAIGGGTENLLEQVCRRNQSDITSYGRQNVKSLVLPKKFAAKVLTIFDPKLI